MDTKNFTFHQATENNCDTKNMDLCPLYPCKIDKIKKDNIPGDKIINVEILNTDPYPLYPCHVTQSAKIEKESCLNPRNIVVNVVL